MISREITSLLYFMFDLSYVFFFFNDTATTQIYTLSLHDALPIFLNYPEFIQMCRPGCYTCSCKIRHAIMRSEEHTSELQSHSDLVCRLLLEKKKKEASRTRASRAADRLRSNDPYSAPACLPLLPR